MLSAYRRRFYMVIYQKLANKNDKDNFINTIINKTLIETSEAYGEKNLKKNFEKEVNTLMNDYYNKEYNLEIKQYDKIRKSNEYTKLFEPYYPEVKVRDASYETDNAADGKYKKQLQSIYSVVNTNNQKNTYTDKVTLN